MIKNKRIVLNFCSLFILYFVQGMPYGLQTRYLPIVMRLHGVSLSELGFFKLLLIPWILKFFISAFIVDVYKTKRFWLLTSLVLLCAGSFLASALAMKSYVYLAVLMFFLNISSTTQDICVDWFAINLLNKDDLGLGNTIQVSGFKLGTLFTGGLIVWLIDYINLQLAFVLVGFIYLVCILLLNASIFNIEKSDIKKEDDEKSADSVQMSTQRFKLLFNVPGTIWMIVFLVVYKLGEQSSLNLLPMYLIDNKIESSTIGLWTGVLGQTSSIIGSFVAGLLLKKTHKSYSTAQWLALIVKLRIVPIVVITAIIYFLKDSFEQRHPMDSTALYSLLLSALIQLFLSGFLTTIAFTLMMELTFKAPANLQATHYSLLAAFEVFGKLLFQPLISVYTDYYGYTNAFAIFTVLYLICILIIRKKPHDLS